MDDEQEINFRKLLKQAELEKPNADFSRKVMAQINLDAETELTSDVTLRTLLERQSVVETPSLAFSQTVMEQLQSLSQPEEPIIPKRIWYFVGGSLLLIILTSLYFVFPTDPSSPAIYLSFIADIAKGMDSLPILYPITFFGVSSLVLLDLILRQEIAKKASLHA